MASLKGRRENWNRIEGLPEVKRTRGFIQGEADLRGNRDVGWSGEGSDFRGVFWE